MTFEDALAHVNSTGRTDFTREQLEAFDTNHDGSINFAGECPMYVSRNAANWYRIHGIDAQQRQGARVP